MNDFLSNMNSIYWWLSVVLVGIILNISSAYFRDGIDKVLSKFSKYWATRTEKKKREWAEKVKELATDNEARREMYRKEIRYMFYGVLWAIMGSTFFIFGIIAKTVYLIKGTGIIIYYISHFCAFFIGYLVIVNIMKAVNIESLLTEAKKSADEKEGD